MSSFRSPLEPQQWRPPRQPKARGRSSQSRFPGNFPDLQWIDMGGCGPEDPILDRQGRLLSGLADGRIVRVQPGARGPAASGPAPATLAITAGRPLGLEWLPDGRLLICDADRGLLALDIAEPALEVLVPGRDCESLDTPTDADIGGGAATGTPPEVHLCNNAAVAADGTIYFTDSTTRFSLEHYMLDLLEHNTTGRLLRRSPDGTVDMLVEGLSFSNGVALAPDESFVLVAETGSYRIHRLWLKGSEAGTCEVFCETPGFPDNMSTGQAPDGSPIFWVALPTSRDWRMDLVHRSPAWLTRFAGWIQDRFPQPPAKVARVIGYNSSGRVAYDFHARGGALHMVTGVRQHGQRLFLGTLEGSRMASIQLPS